MDINIQLNNIKEQIKNMENQFEFIITQSQIMGNLANVQNSLFNMAIQIFNIGIQMVNIGTQIPNIGMDMFNYKIQIQNIGSQIQNLGNQMNMNNINNPMMMMMMPMNFNMNNMKIGGNEEDWMKGYKLAMEEEPKNKKDIIEKKIIIFKTTYGTKIQLCVDYGTTVGDVLIKYLLKINRPELINSSAISFLYNARKIQFGDKTKIEDFFGCNEYPNIVVNDLSSF